MLILINVGRKKNQALVMALIEKLNSQYKNIYIYCNKTQQRHNKTYLKRKCYSHCVQSPPIALRRYTIWEYCQMKFKKK